MSAASRSQRPPLRTRLQLPPNRCTTVAGSSAAPLSLC